MSREENQNYNENWSTSKNNILLIWQALIVHVSISVLIGKNVNNAIDKISASHLYILYIMVLPIVIVGVIDGTFTISMSFRVSILHIKVHMYISMLTSKQA